MKTPNITVVGSINMDMVTITDVVPVQGETVLGKDFRTVPGGKGANQAVAAARLGANVRMIGRVGDDPFGHVLTENLAKEGIITDSVKPVTDCTSGVATILLSDRDNRIIVTKGANEHVTPDYVAAFEQELAASDVVLLQLEIPLETVAYVLEFCAKHHVTTVLNPAPAQKLPAAAWTDATYITPNENECLQLFGDEPDANLRQKLIMTKGADGVQFYENDEQVQVESFRVEPVDTTGAGDTFNGAFAVALGGGTVKEAVRFANAAAALSVQSFGAQGGMPTKAQVQSFLQQQGG
ncbi:ribokinase [Halalkalibacterium halodurans]|uniref:ribokinase n=1 Tax=Halalkalibacterium halodurans TaxID=86665 RepID=UPI002AAA1B69|nr:ribokinase [Halalkalibacterium halodurans]MDY7224233.1 ribokinase [Halalkalibacterium halodurans]MDY7243518.1 ribokinase [Halalkalibacterium halodurans]